MNKRLFAAIAGTVLIGLAANTPARAQDPAAAPSCSAADTQAAMANQAGSLLCLSNGTKADDLLLNVAVDTITLTVENVITTDTSETPPRVSCEAKVSFEGDFHGEAGGPLPGLIFGFHTAGAVESFGYEVGRYDNGGIYVRASKEGGETHCLKMDSLANTSKSADPGKAFDTDQP